MNKTTTIALLSVLILCTLALLPAAAATRGNTLIVDDSGDSILIEYDANGNIVWELTNTIPSHTLYRFDAADRLPNGNMFVNDRASGTDFYARLIEIDNAGNVLWEINTTSASFPWRASDAKRLPNGNTIFTPSNQAKVIEVDSNKNIVWEADATTTSGLSTDSFERVERLSNNNTLLVEGSEKVLEIDYITKAIVWEWSVNDFTANADEVVDAERLPDGNTLISLADNIDGRGFVIEVDHTTKDIVWELNDITTPGLCYPIDVDRLPDGNTLIADYPDWWDYMRVIEVDRDGNIVWEINDTSNPWGIWGYINDVDRLPLPTPPSLEFGDAPDPTYPSNLSSDGARHSETDTECLGLAINGTDWKDFELDANVPDADPLDDGLPALALTTNNPAQTVDFEVTNNITDDTLLVNILLDLNQNGVWDSGEHVVQNQAISLSGPADGTFTSTAFSTVGATEGATWMRITLTRQSINTGWNGTMASAGYTEPFGCGETEDWLVEMVNVPSVGTATGTGTATLESDAGTIDNLTAVPEGTLPGEGKPVGMSFPHGFFSFNITGLDNGQTVNVTITLPDAVPVGTQYWKYGPTLSDPADHWYQIPIGDDDGDNVITITLVDGGLGDDNLTPDGMIVDPGGSGTPPPAPEVPAMTPIGFVMVMFSLFGLVVFTTRKVNKR